MIKNNLVTLCLLFGVMSLSFSKDLDSVFIDLRLECDKELLYSYDFNGLNFAPYQEIKIYNNKINALPLNKVSFLFLGTEKTQKLPVVASPGDTIVIIGSCKALRACKVKSPINDLYSKISSRKKKESKEFGQYINKYRAYFRDSSKVKAVITEMSILDQSRLLYYKELKQVSPFMASFYATDLYLSYQNHGGKYNNEIEYFINEYFSFVDFSNDNYNRLPAIYESMTNYVNTLQKFVKDSDKIIETLEEQMIGIKKPSKAHQMALGSIISSTKKDFIPVYMHYSQEFLDNYSKRYTADCEVLKKEMKELSKLMIGREAPELSFNNPKGELIKLSDYRGKTVLLDFWASWCIPCRRENPHVVKAYNLFKDQGFDVLSVSLDNNKEKWIKAIEADGLIWNHMSDLKGWKSEASAIYNVKAIPRAFLIDKDGIIVAKNLRGKALIEKIDELINGE